MLKAKTACCLVILAALIGGPVGAQSFGGGSYTDREGHWEAYLGARLLQSGSVDFAGGSSIETDDDLGFNFGFGYNFSDHLLVSAEMGWNSVDYTGNLVSADDPPAVSRTISGDLETASLGASVTWHFLTGPITPYVSGSLGWTWIDTNIATGPPQTGCWWDPWWGYICQPIYDTISDDSGSYGLGLGVRWDFNNGGFARLGYDERWFDIRNANGTPDFGSFRFEIGGKF